MVVTVYDLSGFVYLVCSQRSYDPMPMYPQKENWEIRAIVVPPKYMGGKFVVSCSKPKIEAKRLCLCLVQSPRDEAERMICVLFEAQD